MKSSSPRHKSISHQSSHQPASIDRETLCHRYELHLQETNAKDAQAHKSILQSACEKLRRGWVKIGKYMRKDLVPPILRGSYSQYEEFQIFCRRNTKNHLISKITASVILDSLTPLSFSQVAQYNKQFVAILFQRINPQSLMEIVQLFEENSTFFSSLSCKGIKVCLVEGRRNLEKEEFIQICRLIEQKKKSEKEAKKKERQRMLLMKRIALSDIFDKINKNNTPKSNKGENESSSIISYIPTQKSVKHSQQKQQEESQDNRKYTNIVIGVIWKGIFDELIFLDRLNPHSLELEKAERLWTERRKEEQQIFTYLRHRRQEKEKMSQHEIDSHHCVKPADFIVEPR